MVLEALLFIGVLALVGALAGLVGADSRRQDSGEWTRH